MIRSAVCLLVPVLVAAAPEQTLDRAAESYVKLVLAVGRHDSSFVDAYYGPKNWKDEASLGKPVPLSDLRLRTQRLLEQVEWAPGSPRRAFLAKQLVATDAFLRRLGGEKLGLAEEARLLYDIALPEVSLEGLAEARRKIEALLPGPGSLEDRVAALKAKFRVPSDRLPEVCQAALAETKRRTAALLELPKGERFRLEFVKNKPWGGYNWYEGKRSSLIQVNTDLPMALDRVMPLLAHEGYPGHHVYNTLLETQLVEGKHWVEYTIYPLHSPQSLIAEGTAEAALDVIMTDGEQRLFLKKVLAPLAGLDVSELDAYLDLQKALGELSRARLHATRLQLDEGRPEAEVEAFLVKEGLMGPDRARKALEFSRVNRAYVYTYEVGKSLVEAWIGSGPDRQKRFVDLLSRPVTPSEIALIPIGVQ